MAMRRSAAEAARRGRRGRRGPGDAGDAGDVVPAGSEVVHTESEETSSSAEEEDDDADVAPPERPTQRLARETIFRAFISGATPILFRRNQPSSRNLRIKPGALHRSRSALLRLPLTEISAI